LIEFDVRGQPRGSSEKCLAFSKLLKQGCLELRAQEAAQRSGSQNGLRMPEEAEASKKAC